MAYFIMGIERFKFCGFGDASSDALINLANSSLILAAHIEVLEATSRIYNDCLMFFCIVKNKIAIIKDSIIEILILKDRD